MKWGVRSRKITYKANTGSQPWGRYNGSKYSKKPTSVRKEAEVPRQKQISPVFAEIGEEDGFEGLAHLWEENDPQSEASDSAEMNESDRKLAKDCRRLRRARAESKNAVRELYRAESFTEEKFGVGNLVDTGESFGSSHTLLENRMPPPTTDRRLSKSALRSSNPRLIRASGGVDERALPVPRREQPGFVFHPTEADGGGVVDFGRSLYQAVDSSQRRGISSHYSTHKDGIGGAEGGSRDTIMEFSHFTPSLPDTNKMIPSRTKPSDVVEETGNKRAEGALFQRKATYNSKRKAFADKHPSSKMFHLVSKTIPITLPRSSFDRTVKSFQLPLGHSHIPSFASLGKQADGDRRNVLTWSGPKQDVYEVTGLEEKVPLQPTAVFRNTLEPPEPAADLPQKEQELGLSKVSEVRNRKLPQTTSVLVPKGKNEDLEHGKVFVQGGNTQVERHRNADLRTGSRPIRKAIAQGIEEGSSSLTPLTTLRQDLLALPPPKGDFSVLEAKMPRDVQPPRAANDKKGVYLKQTASPGADVETQVQHRARSVVDGKKVIFAGKENVIADFGKVIQQI